MLALQIAFLVVLSVASNWAVLAMLRSADRKYFPSTFVVMKAPEVLVSFDDFNPIDWRGLV